MKVLIIGSGGVGGYYGAMLAKSGHDLFFIARGAHLGAISQNGLTVKSLGDEFTIHPECGETAESFGVADLVIVSVKAYDTASTLGLYHSNVGSDTAILSLQNGIDNETVVAREYGNECVLGGIAFIGSRVENPGVILHTAFGHIAIGELSGGVSERTKRLGKIFENARIKCKVSGDIKRDLYGKMVWNIGFNAICAIVDKSAKEVAEFEETRNIVRSAMLEWIEVANACGVSLNHDLADKNINTTLKGGEVIPSMLHDRRLGRKMEIDTFNGKAVELGEKRGIATPVNMTLAGLARKLDG